MFGLPAATVLVLASLLSAGTATAATFVVDSTADGGDLNPFDFQCDDGTGACTLRAAIEQANAFSDRDRIEFDIPGVGPHTIALTRSGGGVITSPLTIDGTTQPGASANTLAVGSNAAWMIEIDTPGPGQGLVALTVDAPGVELRGLVIDAVIFCAAFLPDFAGSTGSRLLGSRVTNTVVVEGSGVLIGGTGLDARNVIDGGITIFGDDNFVVNNVIGLDPSGTQPVGNRFENGVELLGSRNTLTDNVISSFFAGVSIRRSSENVLVRNRIGTNAAGTGSNGLGNFTGVLVEYGEANQIGLPSATLAEANLIAGNTGPGVHIVGGGGNRVQGNRIGGTGSGGGGVANDHEGILIEGSSGNTIGTPGNAAPDGEGNVITFNRISGVTVKLNVFDPLVATIDNSIRGNRIWRNAFGFEGTIDLDLGGDGSGPGLNDVDFGEPDIDDYVLPDSDEGPNHLQNAPFVTTVMASQGRTEIAGVVNAAFGSYTIDFYSGQSCSGQFYLGQTALVAIPSLTDVTSEFAADLPVTAQGQFFAATATDASGNTSEFAACFEIPDAPGADLSLAISADETSVEPGDIVVFTVTLANHGPFGATDVPVQIERPAGFSSWTPTASHGSYDEAAGLWSVPNLAAGAVALLELTANVAADAAGIIRVEAAAETGLAQIDPFLDANNSDTTSIFVRSGADLMLSQTAPVSALLGSTVPFDLSVTNTGPEDATGVTLSGQFDEGLSNARSSAPGFSYTPETRRWRWLAGDLADGDAAQIHVDADLNAPAVNGMAVAHMVSAFSVPPDDPTPNFSTVIVGVGLAADVEIVSSTLEAEPLIVGEEELDKWRLLIRNNGPDGVERFILRLGCSGPAQMLTAARATPTCVLGPVPEAQGVCPLVCDLELPLAAGQEASAEIALGAAGQVAAVVESSPDAPYYETDPEASILLARPSSGNAGERPGTGGDCGLTGVEPLTLFGLLARRRRRRRRMHLARGMALVLAVAAFGVAPLAARALPIGFAVDTAASSASVAITSPISTSPESVGVSGTADADMALANDALFGLVADSLQLTGAALAFSNTTFVLASPPLSTITFTSTGLGASLTGPLAGGFPVAPGLSLFSLAGSVLRFDSGVIQALGQSFGVPIDITLDLALTPIASPFPASAFAETRVTDLGGGLAEIELSLPFSAPVRVATGSAITTVTFAGELTLRGIVPEPGTAVLVGAGALLLGLARRRPPAPSP